MKKSIIKEIFNGERGHSETVKQNKEYWDILKRAAELSGTLYEGFTEKQKELFDKFSHEGIGLESEASLTYFAEGFKIGLLIGIECMED